MSTFLQPAGLALKENQRATKPWNHFQFSKMEQWRNVPRLTPACDCGRAIPETPIPTPEVSSCRPRPLADGTRRIVLSQPNPMILLTLFRPSGPE